MMEVESALPVVLDTLTRASSQDASVLKPAEAQLKEWESQPGFYSVLLAVVANHAVDLNVRWLATLCVKNGVDRYWRKTATNAIPDEEKTVLRQRLLHTLNEPVQQIAVQLSVLVSKIARLDCPRQWPQLIPSLIEAVGQEGDAVVQQRALLTLHQVTKTMASKRLAMDRKVFHELASHLFPLILSLWTHSISNVYRLIDTPNVPDCVPVSDSLSYLDKANLSLKILRKLLCHGFPDVKSNSEAMTLLFSLLDHMRRLLQIRKRHIDEDQAASTGPDVMDAGISTTSSTTTSTLSSGVMSSSSSSSTLLTEKLEKLIVLHTKVVTDMQEQHPLAFIDMITPTLEFVGQFSFSEEAVQFLFKRFAVQCLNLCRAILRCEEYKLPKVKTESSSSPSSSSSSSSSSESKAAAAAEEANKAKANFFTPEMVGRIGHRLVAHYFLLTEEDLENWEADAEEFAIDEGGESWKFQLRPCTEVLFLSLFHEYRETLSPVLLAMAREQMTPIDDPDDLNKLLKKEAVYTAVGLASYDLFDQVDFDSWFSSYLQAELQNPHPKYRIIRRRVVWLLGQWVGVKLSPNLRPALYGALLPCMRSEEDLVVRLAAANALKVAVDDFEFSVDQFLPYLETVFVLLLQILKEVRECDTKMQVLHVLSFVVERVGTAVRPHAPALVQYLPLLWEDAVEYNMLRAAILSTLVVLVQGLGPLSVGMYDFLLPVISMSTDVQTGDAHVYLLEDGLELWLATLNHAPNPTQQLLQLFGRIPSLIELSSDNLKMVFSIVEAYLYLSPSEMMSSYSNLIVTACLQLFVELRTEGVLMILKLVEIIFRLYPAEGPRVFAPLFPELVHHALAADEFPMVMSLYFSLLARIILQAEDVFDAFLQQESIKNQSTDPGIPPPSTSSFVDSGHPPIPPESISVTTSEGILRRLLITWVDKMDVITQPERRKLAALAFAQLMAPDGSKASVCLAPPVFPSIISAVVEVLHDVCRSENGNEIDVLVMSSSPPTSSFNDEDEDSKPEQQQHQQQQQQHLQSPSSANTSAAEEPEMETEHDKRKRAIMLSDPVHKVSLKEFVSSQLGLCQTKHGPVGFQQLLASVDPDVITQLKHFLQ